MADFRFRVAELHRIGNAADGGGSAISAPNYAGRSGNSKRGKQLHCEIIDKLSNSDITCHRSQQSCVPTQSTKFHLQAVLRRDVTSNISTHLFKYKPSNYVDQFDYIGVNLTMRSNDSIPSAGVTSGTLILDGVLVSNYSPVRTYPFSSKDQGTYVNSYMGVLEASREAKYDRIRRTLISKYPRSLDAINFKKSS